jgi:hypothetical protein
LECGGLPPLSIIAGAGGKQSAVKPAHSKGKASEGKRRNGQKM